MLGYLTLTYLEDLEAELAAERALADRLYKALMQAGSGHGDAKAAYREMRETREAELERES